MIELMRDEIITLKKLKWIMHFGWVKGHAGIEGNELVDRLVKRLQWKMDQLYMTKYEER